MQKDKRGKLLDILALFTINYVPVKRKYNCTTKCLELRRENRLGSMLFHAEVPKLIVFFGECNVNTTTVWQ